MLKILDEDNINTYPKILVPRFIRNFKNLQFAFKDIYPNYKFPIAPSPPRLGEDKIIQYIVLFVALSIIGLLALFFISFFVFTVFFGEDYISSAGRMIIFGCSILIGTIGVILAIKSENDDSKILKRRYERDKEKYQIEEIDFQKLKNKMTSSNFIMAEKQKRLAIKLEETKKKIMKSAQIMRDEEIKKGPSEEFYCKYLNTHTTYQIYKSLKYGYYYPDLVIIKENLVIDLEIDEPYTLSNKEPIHYDQVDEWRDKFFLDNDFVVIHFSEDQILKDPKFCSEIIESVIDICTKLNEKEKSEKYQAFETPIWTHEMAFDLAYNSSRDKIVSKIAILEKQFNL